MLTNEAIKHLYDVGWFQELRDAVDKRIYDQFRKCAEPDDLTRVKAKGDALDEIMREITRVTNEVNK